MIQIIILLQSYKTVVANFIPDDFGLFRRNPWQPLAEPWGSSEPRLINTVVGEQPVFKTAASSGKGWNCTRIWLRLSAFLTKQRFGLQVRSCSSLPCQSGRCPSGSYLTNNCGESCEGGEDSWVRAFWKKIISFESYFALYSVILGISCLELSPEVDKNVLCARNSSRSARCSHDVCRCDPGLFWQEGKCVPRHQCVCYVMGKVRRWDNQVAFLWKSLRGVHG